MKVSIKYLVFMFLFVGSGLLEAKNIITNKSGKIIRFTTIDKNGVVATEERLYDNTSYTLSGNEVSIFARAMKNGSTDSTIALIPDTPISISPDTSYDVILAPDNVTLMLSPVSSNFKAPKAGKPGKPGK